MLQFSVTNPVINILYLRYNCNTLFKLFLNIFLWGHSTLKECPKGFYLTGLWLTDNTSVDIPISSQRALNSFLWLHFNPLATYS